MRGGFKYFSMIQFILSSREIFAMRQNSNIPYEHIIKIEAILCQVQLWSSSFYFIGVEFAETVTILLAIVAIHLMRMTAFPMSCWSHFKSQIEKLSK
jgi:hypothetical protein